ncbi:DUF998 domain-containing protein [Thermobifida cellulosilytica]|uniref:DUF998 domain-containing protein n=1 Tax=Thermobifida cellulosilytica TB100 TaxID=665004 RepID=A0A147KHL9_THECS|nr:DUF998 domain-containing protein [Thermobifida cellulosilytica]KUP96797.1 hypothetical protein AC529_10285 [Thermobifida cellulosilytica TB100]
MAATRGLLRCGLVAGPLFVVVFTVAGALRADYDPLRHPVSSLALTPAGWTQVANFLVTGVLLTAFAFGARRALGERAGLLPWLLGLCGIGLVGAGLFPTDPVSGYPPGSPDALVYTPLGAAHDGASMLFFLGLPLAALVWALRCARGGRWAAAVGSGLAAAAFVVFFLLAGLGFAQQPGLVEVGGLYQRLSVCTGLAWTTAAALALLRGTARDSAAPAEG